MPLWHFHHEIQVMVPPLNYLFQQGVFFQRMYWITHSDKWLRKTMLPMAVIEENITEDIYQTAKLSINYSKVKTGMPSDVDGDLMKRCNAPTLVMAAEKDCLFPAKGVIKRAQEIIPNCTTYLIAGRGHMNNMTDKEKEMIRE